MQTLTSTLRGAGAATTGGLRAVVEGHGWFDLAPHRWQRDEECLSTALELPASRGRRAFDVSLRRAGNDLTLELVGAIGPRTEAALRAAVERMVRHGEDLEPFWKQTDPHPRLSWVRSRGGGRLLRSATLFEDLLKILFTTNCSWALTRTMSAQLVAALGRPAPSGARAFPGPAACAKLDESDWRESIRVGYRAPHAMQISADFASGTLDDAHFEDPTLDTGELRRRLLALPGFGPYAAGQALRLLGRYDDLALDSWCRARGAAIAGRSKAPTDAWFARRYKEFGSHAGLAMWCELTGGELNGELS